MKWTSDKIKFLKENYPQKGSRFCAEYLNISENCVRVCACNLKIKYKMPNSNKIYLDRISTPEFAYLLGFLWADGCVSNHKSTKNLVRCHILNSDGEALKNIFLNTGEWKITKVQKKTGKLQMHFEVYDKNFADFLKENDYKIKSVASPNKILSTIPDNLKHYFWRGYFDGDGCMFVDKKHHSAGICGNIDMCWSDLEELLKSLNIQYSLRKVKTKCGNSSQLSIGDRISVLNFGKYIYQNYSKEQLGLKRKFTKFVEIINKISSNIERSIGNRSLLWSIVKDLRYNLIIYKPNTI